MRVVLLVFVAFLVNLPWAHESWTDHRVAEKGEAVAGVVLEARDLGERYLVDYRLPEDVDPDQQRFSASVDAGTYDHAVASDVIVVRVIPGEPSTNRPEGLVPSSLLRVIAIAGDVTLAAIVALLLVRKRLGL